MAALSNAQISNILNSTSPTGTGGIPGTWTAISASAMKVRLNSTASTAAAGGTEISGSGYTAGGTALSTASTASSAGSNVTLPAGAALSWTNGSGGAWSIVSFDLTDNAGPGRAWFGNFTGQPISVGVSQTFQINIGGITLSLT